MKKFFFLSLLISFTISCSNQISEDKLAKKIAESKSFNTFIEFLPATSKAYKTARKDTSEIKNYSNLTPQQKKDSMIKLVVKDQEYVNNVIKMRGLLLEIDKEFPELSKLTIEERKSVFKKAAELSKLKLKNLLEKDSLKF